MNFVASLLAIYFIEKRKKALKLNGMEMDINKLNKYLSTDISSNKSIDSIERERERKKEIETDRQNRKT